MKQDIWPYWILARLKVCRLLQRKMYDILIINVECNAILSIFLVIRYAWRSFRWFKPIQSDESDVGWYWTWRDGFMQPATNIPWRDGEPGSDFCSCIGKSGLSRDIPCKEENFICQYHTYPGYPFKLLFLVMKHEPLRFSVECSQFNTTDSWSVDFPDKIEYGTTINITCRNDSSKKSISLICQQPSQWYSNQEALELSQTVETEMPWQKCPSGNIH